MTILDPLRIRILCTLILSFGFFSSFSQCRNIEAEAKIADSPNGKSIVIDFKESRTELFQVNLFGPNKNNILNSEKTEFTNLSSGKYLIVIVAKREEDKYCPKSINVTIN